MSNEAGTSRRSVSGKAVVDQSPAHIYAGDAPAAAPHGKQVAYRAAVSRERRAAALGTPQRPAGPGKGAPLLHTKELSDGVPAPRPILGEGGRHG